MKLYVQSESYYNRIYYGSYIKDTFILIRETSHFYTEEHYPIPIKKTTQPHEQKKSLKRIVIFDNNHLIKIRDIKIQTYDKTKTILSLSFIFYSCLSRKSYIGDL